MRGISETKISKVIWKETLSHVVPLALVLVFGFFILNAASDGLEEKRYQNCVNHFNSTDFTNKTVKGNLVCIQNKNLYVPEASAYSTGNPLADIITAPLVFTNLSPWWIEIPGLILLTLFVFGIAATVGPAGVRI